MQTSWKIGWALFVFAVAVAVTVLFRFAFLRQWNESVESSTIRVGYLPIYADLPLFVAEQQKFFSKHNVDIRLVPFQASPDIASALAADRIDAAASVATASALAVETRDPGKFRIFLPRTLLISFRP